MSEIFDVGQLPDNPLKMPPPYWRSGGAVFHIASSLQELESLLNELVSLNRKTDENLQRYFDREPEPPEEDPEFGEICNELWECEDKIKQKAEIAILMAAIESEDLLNMVAVFNLHKHIVEPLEKLSPLEKLQVISTLLDKPEITGDALYGDLKNLSSWRNAFVHGHCVDRSTKSLRHNHLIMPSELPGVPSLVKDAIEMVSCYARLHDYFASISNNPYTKGKSWDVEEIQSMLQKIARYQFAGSNSKYEVSVEPS